MNYKSIICMVKGGESGTNAAKKALKIAKEKQLKVIFIFSADTENMLSGNFGIESNETASRGLDNIGKIIIGRFEDMAEKDGVEYSSKIINENILSKLKRVIIYNKAGYLVIPAIERGPIEKLIIGDRVSEFIDEIKNELPDLKIYFV